MRPESVAADLRRCAKGLYGLETAVELLIRAFGGRFARTGYPWVVEGESRRFWLDADQIGTFAGGLSGGERRILAVVHALATDEPWHAMSGVAGLDRRHQVLLLAAIAHAGGSHEHADWRRGDDGYSTVVQLGSLYPWPPAETAGVVR
jgi:hypothetical protein